MATLRCNKLKQTLEQTKQATKTAIKKGILTPKKKGGPRVRNVFQRAEEKLRDDEDDADDDADDDVDSDEAGDTFEMPKNGSDDDTVSDSDSDSDIDSESDSDSGGSGDELEESYEHAETEASSIDYRDDDTFAIRRAEAKLGLEPDVRDVVGGEAKSYQRRAEEKQLSINTGPDRANDNIVTPRIRILSDGEPSTSPISPSHRAVARDAANGGRFRELSDAPSPSARIDDRVRGLKNRCEEGLGKAR